MSALQLLVFIVGFTLTNANAAKAATCEAPTGCPQMSPGDLTGTGDFSISITNDDTGKTAVTKYESGKSYLVTLKRGGATTGFKGFTLQANEAAGTAGRGQTYLGEFSALPGQTALGCDGTATASNLKSAVSHAAATTFDGVAGLTFKWTAPAAATKDVYFNAIGVQDQTHWYGAKTDITLKVEVQAAAVACTDTTLNTQTACEGRTDCKWNTDKCEVKTTVVACTDASLNTKTACDGRTDCKWNTDKCETKPAAVACTDASLNTKTECEKRTDCEFKDDKCKAKLVKCKDKTVQADCTAMAGCTWGTTCVTTASVECPKLTTEPTCKALAGCKWDTDKCAEADIADGAIKTAASLVTLVVVAFVGMFW